MSSFGNDNWNNFGKMLWWLIMLGILTICSAVIWFMLLLEAATR